MFGINCKSSCSRNVNTRVKLSGASARGIHELAAAALEDGAAQACSGIAALGQGGQNCNLSRDLLRHSQRVLGVRWRLCWVPTLLESPLDGRTVQGKRPILLPHEFVGHPLI